MAKRSVTSAQKDSADPMKSGVIEEEDSHTPSSKQAVHRKTRSSSWSVAFRARKSVFCMATSCNHAGQIIHRLRIAGFPNNDLSALFPDNENADDCGHTRSTPKHRKVPARIAWRTARRVGFATIGALIIPGFGSFIAGGPIIAALSSAAVDDTRGGIAGGLINIGTPEFAARRYESRIKEGQILISVHAEHSEGIARAKEIFQEAGAQDICGTEEASLKQVSRAEPGASSLKPARGPTLRSSSSVGKVSRQKKRKPQKENP